MSEAPKSWKMGDDTVPKLEWDRPKRIELVAASLGAAGATDVHVLMGGERFMFTHNGKFVVLDITTQGRKTKSAFVYGHVFADEDAWNKFVQSKGKEPKESFHEFVPDASTEENINTGVITLIGKLRTQ